MLHSFTFLLLTFFVILWGVVLSIASMVKEAVFFCLHYIYNGLSGAVHFLQHLF